MGLLELLQAGKVDEFNAARGQRTRPDLFGADLSGIALEAVDLSNANLEKADLSGTVLTEASLVRAELSGIDGTGAKLSDAIAVRAKLREAWLEDADLAGTDLSRADLAEAVLVRTQGAYIRLSGARLKDADCRDVSWPDAELAGANLHRARFSGADLSRADLTEASGGEVDLTGARLDHCVGTSVRLPQAKLVGASLVGARMEGADLTGADLSRADLTTADLTRANLSGADLTGARLHGVILAGACLDGIDLSALDLRDVDMSGLDPQALGLSDAQVDGLAAAGAEVDLDAPPKVSDPAVAACGDLAAVLWENPEEGGAPATEDEEEEEKTSIRWALLGEGETVRHGALPIGTEAVLARAVVREGDGFRLLLIQDRPGGVALVGYPLGADGTLGSASIAPLGYRPGVVPVVRVEDGVVWMWGLAQRGPTLAVHRYVDGELETVHSERVATARGFLSRHDPVLACKGGVVLPVGRAGTAPPMRTPEGFPSRVSAAVSHEDRVLAVWFARGAGADAPSGLMHAWLGGRGAPRASWLAPAESVVALDAGGVAEGVWVAWVEVSLEEPGPPDVRLLRLPEGKARRVPVDLDDVESVRLALQPGMPPMLALTSADGSLVVVRGDGTVVGRLGEP